MATKRPYKRPACSRRERSGEESSQIVKNCTKPLQLPIYWVALIRGWSLVTISNRPKKITELTITINVGLKKISEKSWYSLPLLCWCHFNKTCDHFCHGFLPLRWFIYTSWVATILSQPSCPKRADTERREEFSPSHMTALSADNCSEGGKVSRRVCGSSTSGTQPQWRTDYFDRVVKALPIFLCFL